MDKVIGKYSEQAFAIMRIVVGFLFMCHGAQKLFGLFGEPGGGRDPVQLLSLRGLAGVIEFFAGLLVAIGLFTGWAAFLASGQMAVGYFMVHFPRGFWPIQNGGELAAIYSFAFLYIATRGSGSWSISSAVRKRFTGT
jgi:putative oxidoreductase